MNADFISASLDKIVEVRDSSRISNPRASVVIVTYAGGQELLDCLASLAQQSCKDFETIVIDNGKNDSIHGALPDYHVKHLLLKRNYGLSIGRNVGIEYARGNIVIFLDDDAVACPNLVQSHIEAYEKLDIVGLRGKAIGKTRAIYNDLQNHYDLGEDAKPAIVNLGGNASFRRDILIEVDGFNPGFFGHEEVELTYRIVKRCGKEKVIYYPKALIYHDYADSLKKYLKKQIRHSLMRQELEKIHPEISKFLNDYGPQSQDNKESKEYSLVHKMKLVAISRLGSFLAKGARLLYRTQKRVATEE